MTPMTPRQEVREGLCREAAASGRGDTMAIRRCRTAVHKTLELRDQPCALSECRSPHAEMSDSDDSWDDPASLDPTSTTS